MGKMPSAGTHRLANDFSPLNTHNRLAEGLVLFITDQRSIHHSYQCVRQDREPATDPTGCLEPRQITVFNDKPETWKALMLANGRICCQSYAGDVVCCLQLKLCDSKEPER
jgi:hypothetical protein